MVEVLELSKEGFLKYRFQVELMRLWLTTTRSLSAVIERRSGEPPESGLSTRSWQRLPQKCS